MTFYSRALLRSEIVRPRVPAKQLARARRCMEKAFAYSAAASRIIETARDFPPHSTFRWRMNARAMKSRALADAWEALACSDLQGAIKAHGDYRRYARNCVASSTEKVIEGVAA